MTTGYIFLPEQGGGGGTGNILSINGDTTANQIITGGTGIGVATSGGVTTITNTAPAPIGNNNSFAGFDGTGLLESIPGWYFHPVDKGAEVGITYQPDDLGQFYSINSFNINIDPLQASPNDTAAGLNLQMQLDPNSTGFALGTSGACAYLQNIGFNHQGTSNTGALGLVNGYGNIGNGTDPLDVHGMSGYAFFGDFNSGVNLSGPLQGFIFQPNLHTGCTISASGTFSNIFSDGLNGNTQTFAGYCSFNSSPHLGGMHTNNGFTSFNANPQVDSFTGNASATMIYAGGNFQGSLGDGTGGGYTAVQVNPQITNLNVNSRGINIGPQITAGTADWTGININNGGFTTSGNIQGLVINGPMTAVAINSQGHHNLSSEFQLISGQGQVYGNVIGGEIRIDDGITPATITGTDTLANNMAYSVNTGLAGSTWTAASVVGLTTLGFVGQIVGAGTITGPINFCLAGYADAHTGHIDRVNNFHAAAVPTGAGGTMDESVAFLAEAPFGFVATDNWGFRSDNALENYMERLAISTANKKVTNASCAIEVGGTTQAVRFSNLTTTERLALTALAGMQVFDTTLNQMAYYNGSTWVTF